MIRLIRLAMYLGVGAIFHAIFVGAHFDWSSVWTWAWLFGWPAMLVITFWVIIVLVVIVVLVLAGAAAVWEGL